MARPGKRLVEVKLNNGNIRRLRKSPAVLSYLLRKAAEIQSAAGGAAAGYDVVSGLGRNRARAAVVAYTYEARRENARQNTLLRSIDSARGN